MLLRPAVKGRERGQIIVLFAMAIVVMLVFASMVVDVGLLRITRQNLVNTLDAAALAGGTKLPVDGYNGGVQPNGEAANSQYTLANELIHRTIEANYPGLNPNYPNPPPKSVYEIAYKCVIGALPSGQPNIARDVPWVCDLKRSLGRDPIATDFTGAGPTRTSNCRPDLLDKCNTVVITGNATQNYSFGRVVGINSGSTGAVVSVACNGPCGAPPEIPVDVVLITDRTASMSAQDIADLQSGADALLSVFNPALQRVALGTIGPSRVTAAGAPALDACPSGSTSPLRNLSSPANQVYGVGQTPRDNVNFFANPADLGKWIPVGFTGTDTGTPAVTWNEPYSTIVNGVGVTNTNSRIWKAVSCFYSYTHGTNLNTSVSMAATWLNTYGRPNVKKAIILETDGAPQLGDGSARYTCAASNNTATTVKAGGIEIFTIGFGIGNVRCPYPNIIQPSNCSGTTGRNVNESATWSCDPVSTLLASMASPNTTTSPQHFWNAPDAATLKAAFYQAAISIAGTGPKLIQLYPTPFITAVSPSVGTLLGGTTVTITGKFFTGATSVRFGGAGVAFTVVSDTSISATSPAGTPGSTVNVSVTTPGGTTPAVDGSAYTYNSP